MGGAFKPLSTMQIMDNHLDANIENEEVTATNQIPR